MSNRCQTEKQPHQFHRTRWDELKKVRSDFPSTAVRCHTGMAIGYPADSPLPLPLLPLQLLWSSSPHPRSPLPPSPRRESGMVYSMRTCHCHSGGDGSRSVRAEGGEGRLHPCLPLQCGGCCCSEATPGRPLHSSSLSFSTKTPRGPPRL